MKSDNELIAEFMGLVRHEADATYNLPQYYRPENDKRKKGSFAGYPEQLKYATSWDWLMPVVEKITKTNIMNQAWYDTKYALIDGDIKIVYTRVVEFIKWYNSQPK